MPIRPALTLAALLSLAAGGARSAPSLERQAEQDREALARIVPQRTARICSEAPLPGHARCHAQMVVDDRATRAAR